MSKTEFKHFFQYELPAENHREGKTGHVIDIIATWDGFMISNKPYPFIRYNLITKNDLFAVKDWYKVDMACEEIAKEHFIPLVKQQKIKDAQEQLKQAREALNEFENPILERMAEPAY